MKQQQIESKEIEVAKVLNVLIHQCIFFKITFLEYKVLFCWPLGYMLKYPAEYSFIKIVLKT